MLYPVGRHDPDTLRRLTSELPLPVNAIALPDQDDPASFGPLGVGRISFGPFLQRALAANGPRRFWPAGLFSRSTASGTAALGFAANRRRCAVAAYGASVVGAEPWR